MIIGVIGDTHDRLEFVDRFIAKFEAAGVDMVLHLGDIISPFAAKRFADIARRVDFKAVFGNNDGEKAGLSATISQWGEIHDGPLRVEAAGKVIVVNHEPMGAAEVRALHPDADYFFSAHTHELADERDGGLRLINPGEACGYLGGRATAGLLEPEADDFRLIEL